MHLLGRALDAFLLRDAERTIERYTPEQHADIRWSYEAALRRVRAADRIVDDAKLPIAFALYRDAIALLVKAIAASFDRGTESIELDASRAFAYLRELASARRIPPLPAYVEQAESVLAAEGRTTSENIAPDVVLANRGAIESTIGTLAAMVEPRTPAKIRSVRRRRVAALGILTLTLVAALSAPLFHPKNIARGKPVAVHLPNPSSHAPPDHSGLVNGEIEATYGVHTAQPGPSWVRIDLEESYTIERVKVFNRSDGWLDEGLPFTMEFSDDGETFVEVAVRSEPFSGHAPWVFVPQGDKREARYIRIRSARYIALAEVEVNGHR